MKILVATYLLLIIGCNTGGTPSHKQHNSGLNQGSYAILNCEDIDSFGISLFDSGRSTGFSTKVGMTRLKYSISKRGKLIVNGEEMQCYFVREGVLHSNNKNILLIPIETPSYLNKMFIDSLEHEFQKSGIYSRDSFLVQRAIREHRYSLFLEHWNKLVEEHCQ